MARSAAKLTTTEETPVDAEFDLTPVIEGVESFEWETVAKESAIGVILDAIGDEFIAKFTGRETITPDKDDPFDILAFEDSRGKRYSLSPSYKLSQAFEKIEPGTWTRVTLVALLDTGNLQPMKDYRVDAKK